MAGRMTAAALARRYWYLITANPLWLLGLWPDIDPRGLTPADALQRAAARVQEKLSSIVDKAIPASTAAALVCAR
jgi:hypothetical protein